MKRKTLLLAITVLTLLLIAVGAQAQTPSTLTVDLSGSWNKDITVALHQSDGVSGTVGAAVWSVNNQHGAVRTYNVSPGTYDLKLTQGPKQLVIDALDCSSNCDAGDVVETLTVDLSGAWNKDITVQLYVNDGGLIWSVNNQHGGLRTYNVLKNTYDLKLVQGPKVLDVADIDCNGGSCNAGDVIADLKVDLSGAWNKDITVQLKTSDEQLIWSVNNQHGGERHYNVLKNTYDIALVQGPATLEVDDQDCTDDACDAGDVVEMLTVDLSGAWNKDITVQLYVNDGGLIWSVNNQHGGLRTYNVLKNTYDLKLVQGPKVLDVADIDCNGGSCNAGDVIADLKVDLSGAWNKDITVQLKTSDEQLIWSVNNQHGGERHYNVLKNTYDIALVQGPATLEVDDQDCTDDACDAGDVVEMLTVDLSGAWNKDITVQLYINDGGLIWSVNNQHGGLRTYNVLKNTYDLKLVQGPKVLDVADIDCNGGSCNAGDVIAQLSVDHNALTGVTTELHLNDGAVCSSGALIWGVNNQSGVKNYDVLKNHYDVVLKRGVDTYRWDAVNCTGESCLLNKSTLTVKFPGIGGVHVYLYTPNGVADTVSGSPIASQTYKSDQAVFTNLTNGKYDVKVVQGAMNKIVDDVVVMGDCATVDNIVATLTVNFPGISGVHTYVKTNDGIANSFTGGDVTNTTYKNNTTTMTVLKGVYDVKVVQGAQQNIYDGVDCTSGTCTIDNIVATLTVNFPGINGVHSYVKTNDGVANSFTGGDVTNTTYKNNTTTMTVLKGVYDVKVVQGAQQNIYDGVDCTSGTCTIDNIVATLTVNFPGINGVHSYVKTNDGGANSFTGGDVTNTTYKNNSTTMAVLKGVYDLRVVMGVEADIVDAVDCLGNVCWVQLLHLVNHSYNAAVPMNWDAYGLAGGTAKPAFGGSWGNQCAGQTNAKGRLWCAMTRSDFTKFAMTYNQGTVEQLLATLTSTKYTWQTDELTIKLIDHAGAGLAGGVVDQGGGSWDLNKCSTDASGLCKLEVFGGKSYKFRITFNFLGEEHTFSVPSGGHTETWQTGQVHSDTNTCTSYSTGAWRPFTQDMQQFAGTRTFRFSGFADTAYTITAGVVNSIH